MTASIHRAIRQPISEHCQAVGKRILHLRLYQEHSGFVCERELIEVDGTGIIQALPFHSLLEIQEFLMSDPHYGAIKKGAGKLLDIFALEVSHEIASS